MEKPLKLKKNLVKKSLQKKQEKNQVNQCQKKWKKAKEKKIYYKRWWRNWNWRNTKLTKKKYIKISIEEEVIVESSEEKAKKYKTIDKKNPKKPIYQKSKAKRNIKNGIKIFKEEIEKEEASEEVEQPKSKPKN